MEDNVCINEDCPHNDQGSETGCSANLSVWEDCPQAEFDEEDE